LRVLAIDYGSNAVGLAICDELQLTTRPLATIRRKGGRRVDLPQEIRRYVEQYEIATLVIGMPLNMDGSRGEAARRVERFIATLRPLISIPIETSDERLTSREADSRLRAAGLGERERRAKSDEYAAVIILEDFLAAAKRPHPTDSLDSSDQVE
jgi:putative Holliday junction resolvase